MKNYKIIIIDHESTMHKLKDLLKHGGFIISSSHPCDEISAAPIINELIRFDILLSEECTIPLFQKIHAITPPPYFMMTSRIDDTDHLLRMEEGIRDTIDRLIGPAAGRTPFKAGLNPKSPITEEGKLAVGPISIDSNNYSVSVFDSEIHLTPAEFKILRFLASNAEKVITRQELSAEIYGPAIENRCRVIDCHISHLRKKISRHLPAQKVIRSAYGTGYAFRIPEKA